MSVLAYLNQYGESSDGETEEEFYGFDLENEQPPSAQPVYKAANILESIVSSRNGNKETVALPMDITERINQPVYSGCNADLKPGTSSEGRKSDEQTATNLNQTECNAVTQNWDTDSSGSFFELRPKRKSGNKTKKETKRENSARKRRLSHMAILDNCGCLRNCHEKFTRDDRLLFHNTFWDLNSVGQGNLIRQYAHLKPIKRRRKRKVTTDLVKRLAFTCTLPSSSSDPVVVCRKFFLNTLGFRENSGCIQATQNGPPVYRRGKYQRDRKVREAIRAHLFGYKPTISHYRRAHAPNRLYLPSDLTQQSLHRDYEAKLSPKASYSLYCKVVKESNVSFVKLGHEECETCAAAELRSKVNGHSEVNDCDCIDCSEHKLHLKRAKESRLSYQADGDEVLQDEAVFSVDLQKVIQLPRLDGFKSVIFSQRLLVFNESFAPVGAYSRSFPVTACIWPESVNGRTANEILSCFFKVIKKYAYLKTLTFWLDNCSSQNKNWNLFQHVILLINSSEIQVQRILFKYFESGHTFMAADSFHAAVESKMRHTRVVTFENFKSAVGNAKKNVDVLDMQAVDFFQAKLTVSQYTINQCTPRPYVDTMRKVVFEKGRFELGYTDNINSEDLQYCQLFSKKQLKLIGQDSFSVEDNVRWQNSPRGIEAERKASLLKVVVPVVTEEEKSFFIDLPTKPQASD